MVSGRRFDQEREDCNLSCGATKYFNSVSVKLVKISNFIGVTTSILQCIM